MLTKTPTVGALCLAAIVTTGCPDRTVQPMIESPGCDAVVTVGDEIEVDFFLTSIPEDIGGLHGSTLQSWLAAGVELSDVLIDADADGCGITVANQGQIVDELLEFFLICNQGPFQYPKDGAGTAEVATFVLEVTDPDWFLGVFPGTFFFGTNAAGEQAFIQILAEGADSCGSGTLLAP